MAADKARNLGIDILCCMGVMMLLCLQYIDTIGYFEDPVTSWATAAPIAWRWFCLSGAAVLSAGTGYILSSKKFSMGYFKIFIRLIYVYVICSLVAIAMRLTLLQEEMTLPEILQAFLRFQTTDTSSFAGMYFGILLAAPFLNAAFQGLPNRNARLLFLCLTTAFGTLQPILYIEGIYLLPEWCMGLFPVAAYIAGAYLKKYLKKRHIPVFLLVLLLLIAAETAIVTWTSLPEGKLFCPWLNSLATFPAFGTALCLLGLFHSKKNGKSSVHRFFAGAAGGALAALLLGDPLIDISMPAILERFPDPDIRYWVGLGVVPVLFILCCVLGLMLQLPLLGIRSLFRSSDVEDEAEDEDAPKKKRRKGEVSMPERVHTKPGKSLTRSDSRHSIKVAVSEPEADLFMTQPAEELPPGMREVALPTPPEPEPEPEPEPVPEEPKEPPVPVSLYKPKHGADREFPTMKIYTPPSEPRPQPSLEEILQMTPDEENKED
ncbi:MAG: hypothetical protein K5695_13310 [Oscillospiraceae bacterium]|nr:hypothetical protein [Oscillospiraceae bacterium]